MGFSDERGTSAVEFALVAPVFALLVAGTIDLGGALYTKFRLAGAVSAAANYALVNQANVSSTGGSTLASSLASILSSSSTGKQTAGAIIVNNGPTAALSSGSVTTAGTAANADSCYCPSLVAGAVVWGSAVSCSGTCPNGAAAGKYVSIVATQNYTPVFSNYGVVLNGAVRVAAVVQAQ